MFDVLKIENAGMPFPSNNAKNTNDYSCFNELTSQFGVYVFENTADRSILYVGQASKQNLKDRITQNYTESDSGGTFRRNWCEFEKKEFQDFKEMLSTACIKVICIPESAGILICTMETILISTLSPQYNK